METNTYLQKKEKTSMLSLQNTKKQRKGEERGRKEVERDRRRTKDKIDNRMEWSPITVIIGTAHDTKISKLIVQNRISNIQTKTTT